MKTKNFNLLVKKQLFDSVPIRIGKHSHNKNFTGYILMFLLIATIIAAFIYVFSIFVKSYCGIKINRIVNIESRQFELLSIIYFAIILVLTIYSTINLSYSLFENSDLHVLMSLPFSSMEIFLSRVFVLYLKEILISLVAILCINLTLFISLNITTTYNVLLSFLIALIIPIIPFTISSILVLPFYYIKKLISSHYILMFIIITLIMAAFCVGYAYVFNIVEDLIISGNITTLFNEKTMNAIITFASNAYPGNLLANILLNRSTLANLGIYLGSSIAFGVVGIVIVYLLFNKISKASAILVTPHIRTTRTPVVINNKFLSLLYKEMLLVIKTPNYAYMYLTIAVIMPLIAFFTAKTGSSVLSNMLGNVDISFEICTFSLILYSTLTNTFCSTNISRDGYMAMAQKTMPYSVYEVLGAKMLFCSIISILSIIIACIVFAATGIEKPLAAFMSFISALFLAIAQILFATRLDLNHPHFAKEDDGEIKEANDNVSIIIILGLLFSLIIGISLLINPIIALINGDAVVNQSKVASILIALLIPLFILGLSLVFFFVNLKKRYAHLDSEA